jgi:pimeloyl-ACP methyl ester carboxylesterase
VNGIELVYEVIGDPSGHPVVLINGAGGQLVSWDRGFLDMLISRGAYLITFDNRDSGLSTHTDGPTDWAPAIGGAEITEGYTLHDMADDIAGLLDVLGIDRAHVAGASLGGHIAQTFALDYPDRTLSLCSIMSSTGSPALPPSPAVIEFLQRRPPAQDRASIIDREIEALQVFGSKGIPIDWDVVRERAGRQYDRCFYPAGFARQLVAVVRSGDRTEALGGLRVPTVVIHGTDDGLVDPEAGKLTARSIAGARLVLVEGMGHDMPPGSWPIIVDALMENVETAAQNA